MTVKRIQILKPKYYFLCILISFISLSVSAQGKFSLGIDAGVRNEKARFDDPQGYIFRDLWPSATIGLAATYEYSDRWEFELGVYRTTFNVAISAYYREPGYMPFTRYGNQGGGGFATLQIPLRAIYSPGIQFRKFSLHFFGGVIMLQQFEFKSSTGFRGAGTDVFPQPAPTIGMEYASEISNRSSIALELGSEIRYQLSRRFHLAYRFSGNLGTTAKVRIYGEYFASNNPQVIHDFEVLQRGTSLNHFLSIRYKLGKKIEKEKWWE